MRTKVIVTKNGVKRVNLTEEENRKRDIEEASAIAEAKAEALVAHRYKKENGGVLVRDVLFQTDRETRATLLGMRYSADKDKKFKANWKSLDGFTELSYDDIVEVYGAVQEHITKCFAAEHAVLANMGNYTTVDEVTAAFDSEFEK